MLSLLAANSTAAGREKGERFPLRQRAGLLLLTSILWTSSGVSQPLRTGAHQEESGYIAVLHDHVSWTSPERVADDLRSSNAEVRSGALLMLGMTATQVHRQKWDQAPGTKSATTEIAKPDMVRLTYAALGEDASQEAILAVAFTEVADTFLAVAMHTGQGWHRIAAVDCWCKYDMLIGTDALSEFSRLVPAPGVETSSPIHFELVVHASGGGTGIYTQDEAQFRVRNGELRSVLSFTSRHMSCVEPHLCDLTRRWFYWTNSEGVPLGILVEGRGRFSSDTEPHVNRAVRDLEMRHLQTTRCTSYGWNREQFRYERLASRSNACRQERQ